MLEIFIAILLTTAIAGYDVAHMPVKAEVPQEIALPTPTPAILVIPTDIVGYIHYKFGDDAWKAFKVLDCENKGLNPYAINVNKNGSIDRGYWQINTIHPVTDACARDVKCSTDYAFRMYSNDDNTFIRWSCGKRLGL